MAASLARVLSRRSWRAASTGWLPAAAAAGAAVATASAVHTKGPAAHCEAKQGALSPHAEFPTGGRWHTTGAERENLLLGVPKKGRLYEKVSKMLAGAGIEYTRGDRIDIAQSTNLPLTIVFLPAKDIATYVGDGDVDVGITGEDVVAESGVDVQVLLQLGIGKCNLSVQAFKDERLTPQDLAGKRIATSFPALAARFFEQYETPGNPTKIRCISGSVEAACGLGLADGIVDLVETGTTMRAAGLEEVATVMKSQAVLIMNPHTRHRELVEVIRKRIDGYLLAQSWVMVTYNIHRLNLKRAEQVTPGRRSPSVMPLEDNSWVAVSALVPKSKAASVMDELEKLGATDILLTGLLSTRMGDSTAVVMGV